MLGVRYFKNCPSRDSENDCPWVSVDGTAWNHSSEKTARPCHLAPNAIYTMRCGYFPRELLKVYPYFLEFGRDQGQKLHMRQVQFHSFQYSSRNSQSRLWPMHYLIFALRHDITGSTKNTHLEYGFLVIKLYAHTSPLNSFQKQANCKRKLTFVEEKSHSKEESQTPNCKAKSSKVTTPVRSHL